ncbi:hypothetical protein VMCG_03319 [Cytospora schulzeri]|uniref:Uncharacterized protein n=1 Tax=Cytospora schulzeri TaxID=448051 RepID=A0A423WY17_9PEZI|nr:hypothetical protein VMCG_03319 [Valsa malicola]
MRAFNPETPANAGTRINIAVSRRGEDAYNAAFVMLKQNPFSVYTFVFVFAAIHLLPIRGIATAAKRLSDRVSENRNNIFAIFDIVQSVLEMLILILASTFFCLVKLAYHLAIHAKSEMGPGSWSGIIMQRCSNCPEPEPEPKAPRRSYSDPAVVERNMRITQLELQLQEWRDLISHKNIEHAKKEHQFEEEISTLDEANKAQAVTLQQIRRFHQSVGLDRGTEAIIRDLRRQLEDAPKQAKKREDELLEEIRQLKEQLQKKDEEHNEWRDKDRLYNAYVNEVTKWKNIARECIRQRDVAQKKAEDLQESLAMDNTEDNSPQQEHGQENDHGENQVARDPLPDNEGKPFGMRLTYADGTPVGMPGARTQSNDDWVVISGSSSSSSRSGDDDNDDGADGTANAETAPSAPAPSTSQGPGPSSSFHKSFLGTTRPSGAKYKANYKAYDGWETVSDSSSSSSDDTTDEGENATQGAPEPFSSSGPGPSTSFRNPFTNLKEKKGGSSRSGDYGAKKPGARRGGGAGGSSRR